MEAQTDAVAKRLAELAEQEAAFHVRATEVQVSKLRTQQDISALERRTQIWLANEKRKLMREAFEKEQQHTIEQSKRAWEHQQMLSLESSERSMLKGIDILHAPIPTIAPTLVSTPQRRARWRFSLRRAKR